VLIIVSRVSYCTVLVLHCAGCTRRSTGPASFRMRPTAAWRNHSHLLRVRWHVHFAQLSVPFVHFHIRPQQHPIGPNHDDLGTSISSITTPAGDLPTVPLTALCPNLHYFKALSKSRSLESFWTSLFNKYIFVLWLTRLLVLSMRLSISIELVKRGWRGP
jgi:hypothetical protein